MRLFVAAILLGATVGLSGCGGEAPSDPYSGMRMLTPAEAGVSEQEQEDPVQQAEKAYNAKFARKTRRTR
jgi:hypothetical protein